MSIEQCIPSSPILQESLRIKDVLLPARKRIEAVNTINEDRVLKSIRIQLGYDSDFADLSGLIDERVEKVPMITPRMVAGVLPLSAESARTTLEARKTLADIHKHRNFRLAVGIGECSVRDPEMTIEYAKKVAIWQKQFPNLFLMQRTFFEKPRTPRKLGDEAPWKGFMYDPLLDGSNDINLGVIAARIILCTITKMGVPALKEQLNALTPQFLDGLITQDNIGARNVGDQKSMEYASGTSAIVGAKNNLDGDIEAAMQAVASAHGEHAFLGIDNYGNLCLVKTLGNDTAHIILRGGSNGPNYGKDHIQEARVLADKYGVNLSIDIDASHGNSNKIAKNQIQVAEDVSGQIEEGEFSITGFQMETSLVEGSQPFKLGEAKNLIYGQSITDETLGIADTEYCLTTLNESTAKRSKLTISDWAT